MLVEKCNFCENEISDKSVVHGIYKTSSYIDGMSININVGSKKPFLARIELKVFPQHYQFSDDTKNLHYCRNCFFKIIQTACFDEKVD